VNKLLLTTFFALFLSIPALLAQDKVSDDKLSARYSAEQITDLKQNSPQQYAFWGYYADHRGSIVQLPTEKSDEGLSEIDFDIQAMNFLSVDLTSYWANGAVLRIAGTDKIMVIKPQELFLEEFNASKL